MSRPRLLDLFCCAGGAAMGYHRAGFDVTGVDINPQPNYPFHFIQGDALVIGERLLPFVHAAHASPPCQKYSGAQRIRKREHPDLIPATRQLLLESGRPYVIENVEGAPLVDPVMLCGAMFPGLQTYRHRLFECSFRVNVPAHPHHDAPQRKMGRRPLAGEFMHVVGNYSDVARAKIAMGIDWMSRNEMSEAIPPAYTEYLGRQLMAQVVVGDLV